MRLISARSVRVLAASSWVVAAALVPQSGTADVAGAPAGAEKSAYHLFNPTPREQMREMSTDRPDLTESPYTVDAGHFQLEMDLIKFNRDETRRQDVPEGLGGEAEATTWTYLAPNFKVGLTNYSDLQIILGGITRERTRTAEETNRLDGFGDVTFRTKFNLMGNDSGNVAIGVMPFVTVPSGAPGIGSSKTQGGIILPIAIKLPREWNLGLMFELDKVYDNVASGYHSEFISTITASHSVFGSLGYYIEFFSNATHQKGGDWIASINGGLTYGIGEDIQLDAGANIGVTDAADDVNPFLGVSFRY